MSICGSADLTPNTRDGEIEPSDALLELPRACSGTAHPPQLEPDLVRGPLGHMWLRGIGYDALRSELADGYYPDDTL